MGVTWYQNNLNFETSVERLYFQGHARFKPCLEFSYHRLRAADQWRSFVIQAIPIPVQLSMLITICRKQKSFQGQKDANVRNRYEQKTNTVFRNELRASFPSGRSLLEKGKWQLIVTLVKWTANTSLALPSKGGAFSRGKSNGWMQHRPNTQQRVALPSKGGASSRRRSSG